MRAHPIPADRNTYGVGDVLAEQIELQLRDIVEHPGADPASRQVADMYASWMDEAGIEARGTAPLRPYLDRIAAVHDKAGLIALFATPGFASPIRIGIQPDPGRPDPLCRRPPTRAGSACRAAIIICARAPITTATAPPIAPI